MAGNLLNDTFHTYSWDVYGKLSTIDSSTCGTSGTCLTYDALGRVVEKNVGGVFTQILYSPVGKIALLSGQTTQRSYMPLPGGATESEIGAMAGTHNVWHKDWLGSVRLASRVADRTVVFDHAFAPFGEVYDEAIDPSAALDFTGDTQDLIAGTFDTDNRELNPTQGRWLSPDPAGLAAVDPTNPQTFNRYAYVVNNPLNMVDPSGLFMLTCAVLEDCGSDNQPDGGGDGGADWSGFTDLCAFGGNCGGSGPVGRPAEPPPKPPRLKHTKPQQAGNCVTPNFAQQLAIDLLTPIADLTDRTVGYGVGGSVGAGKGAFGFNLSASQQLVVAPDGTAGLATSYTKQVFGVASQGTAGLAGIQVTSSTAQTATDLQGYSLDAGVSAADGFGVGGDISVSASDAGGAVVTLTGTVGGGFGEYSHGGQLTQTVVTPFCGG